MSESSSYEPKNGNGTKVDLAVLKTEIVHGFKHLDKRLGTIEEELKEHSSAIEKCKTEIAILKATALRIDVVRLSALAGSVVLIVMGLATVITKVAGLW